MTQRDALLLMQGQLRNHLHALDHMPVVVAQIRQRMKALDQTLTTQLTDIDPELATLLPTEDLEYSEEGEPSLDHAWARTLAKLQTIPGIGLLTALWIVVTAMNFSLCSSAEQAAAYAGLAPMTRESGTSIYKRPCIGHTDSGRLRTAFYMATLSATGYNPIIKGFYARLRAAGKPAKVAPLCGGTQIVAPGLCGCHPPGGF